MQNPSTHRHPCMKTTTILLAFPFAILLACVLSSCEPPQGPAEEIGEAIDDAADRRPAEGVKDALEDGVN